MPLPVQSQPWPGQRAVLLVHGIGNAKPGDYAELRTAVRSALGPAAADTAIYQLFYDQVNDWFASKTQLAVMLQQARSAMSGKINDAELGDTIAEVAADVLWPVLLADARAAVREAYLRQLKQIVQDGVASGVRARDQHLSIICHSLGCFHTYEALHHAAGIAKHQLRPASDGVRFDNVIFMASPVQLIRSVAGSLGKLVPNRRWLYTVQGDALSIPSEQGVLGTVPSVRNWVSITGNLDPVGGHFFRSRADWATMDVPGQETIVDSQDSLNISTKTELAQTLRASLRDREPPHIALNNPHSWENYVARNAQRLRELIVT